MVIFDKVKNGNRGYFPFGFPAVSLFESYPPPYEA
jgi:hypothetical protein